VKPRRNLLLGVVIVLLGLVLLLPRTEAKKATAENDKLSKLMKAKLEHSQKILQGIALNDFKMIQKNAEELVEISKTEEWQHLKTATYQLHSNGFRRAASELVENAKEKNIDAAALSYVNLTLTCVNCHKHVREVRMTKLEPSTPIPELRRQ
jgi:hypothetical protein